jgi:hypothetical protein
MDPGDIVPMVVIVTATVVTGGVLLLRPLARGLGDLVQLMIDERRARAAPAPPAVETARVLDVLEGIETRLARLEERQTFTDALLAAGRDPGQDPRAPARKPTQTAG